MGFEYVILLYPSPLSANKGATFFNHHHFSQANAYLKEHGMEPIDWSIQSFVCCTYSLDSWDWDGFIPVSREWIENAILVIRGE